MRVLVFNTQQSAIDAVSTIDINGANLFAARGFTIINGEIVGERLSDGVSQPDAQRTITWDVPRQRLDGKWIVSHPENHPSGSLVIDGGGTLASAYVMSGVTYDAIEEYNLAWFPDVDVAP